MRFKGTYTGEEVTVKFIAGGITSGDHFGDWCEPDLDDLEVVSLEILGVPVFLGDLPSNLEKVIWELAESVDFEEDC